MRQLFLLARKDWEADVVFELFEQPAFHGKQGFDKEELAQCLSWMKDARVRQKWDGANGFVEGMNRMMRGLIFLLPEDEGLPRVKSIDWGGAELLDRLMRTFLLLKKWSDVFQSSSCRLLGEWVELIERAAKRALRSGTGRSRADAAVLEKGGQSGGAFCRNTSSFFPDRRIIRARMLFRFGFARRRRGRIDSIRLFKAGSRAACEGDFSHRHGKRRIPAADHALDLRLEEPQSRPIRSRKTPLARGVVCRRRTVSPISYCHRSFEDRTGCGFALDGSGMARNDRSILSAAEKSLRPPECRNISLLPYHPSYFQKGTSFSRLDFLAARRSEQIQESLWTRELPAEEIRSIDLEDLSLAAANPWKYFLKTFLGTWLKDEKLFSDLRLKDFDFSSYARKKLVKEMFQSPMEDILQRRKAELPPGAFRGWAELKLKEEYSVWKTTLAEWGLEFRDFFSLRFSEGVSEVRQEREDLWGSSSH